MAANNLTIGHRENFSVRPVEGWTEKFRFGERQVDPVSTTRTPRRTILLFREVILYQILSCIELPP